MDIMYEGEEFEEEVEVEVEADPVGEGGAGTGSADPMSLSASATALAVNTRVWARFGASAALGLLSFHPVRWYKGKVEAAADGVYTIL